MIEESSERLRRTMLVVVLPVLTVAGIIGPIAARWSELPDPMAVGWDGNGAARTALSPGGFLAVQAVVAALAVAGFVVAGLGRRVTPIYRGTAAVVAVAVAPSFALVSIFTVEVNRGADDWAEVEDPSWWLWTATAVVATLVGLVAVGWLVRGLFRTPTPPLEEQPTAGLDMAAATDVAWYSQATSGWPMLLAVPMTLIGVAWTVGALFGMTDSVGLGGALGVLVGLSLIIGGLAALAFSTILVSIDRRGLTVNYGMLPWPRSHVDLDAIESAHAIEVKPMEHGGWGYRGSRKVFGKAAVVIRGGEGIRLGLKDGNEFVVTVDDADRGAGVINDLRAAAAS